MKFFIFALLFVGVAVYAVAADPHRIDELENNLTGTIVDIVDKLLHIIDNCSSRLFTGIFKLIRSVVSIIVQATLGNSDDTTPAIGLTSTPAGGLAPTSAADGNTMAAVTDQSTNSA